VRRVGHPFAIEPFAGSLLNGATGRVHDEHASPGQISTTRLL